MSKQQGAAFWLLICLFGVLVGISAFGGWHFIMHLERQTTHAAEESTTTAPQASATRTPQPRPLLPAALIPLPEPEAGPEDAAPASMADLTLKGLITRSDPSRSRALIAKGKAAEQAYSQGQEIQDSVTLETIDSDHVVLRVNNRRETLYLNRTRPGTPADEQTVRQAGEPESVQGSSAARLLGDFLHNRDPSLSRNPALAESIEGESDYLPTGQATDGVVSHDEAEPKAELEESRDNEGEDWTNDGSDEVEGMEQTGEVEEQ